MSDLSEDDLEKYLSAKAKQDQENENKHEPKSAYETCVLKESAKIHEMVAQAQREARERSEDE
jgi:hypothetical protein